MNISSDRLLSLIAFLAVCGVVVSSVSLQHHYATSKTTYCEIGGAFNCDIVNRSEYSTVLGIPVALIGMVGYAALASLATVFRERRDSLLLLFAGSVAGLAFALYLTYVEGHVLGVWCILCLTSLALISATATCSSMAWVKRGAQRVP